MKTKVIVLSLLAISLFSCKTKDDTKSNISVEINEDAKSENIVEFMLMNYGNGGYNKKISDNDQISNSFETILNLSKKYKFNEERSRNGFGKYNFSFTFKESKSLTAVFNDSEPYYFSLSGDYVLNDIEKGHDLFSTMEKEDFDIVKNIIEANK